MKFNYATQTDSLLPYKRSPPTLFFSRASNVTAAISENTAKVEQAESEQILLLSVKPEKFVQSHKFL